MVRVRVRATRSPPSPARRIGPSSAELVPSREETSERGVRRSGHGSRIESIQACPRPRARSGATCTRQGEHTRRIAIRRWSVLPIGPGCPPGRNSGVASLQPARAHGELAACPAPADCARGANSARTLDPAMGGGMRRVEGCMPCGDRRWIPGLTPRPVEVAQVMQKARPIAHRAPPALPSAPRAQDAAPPERACRGLPQGSACDAARADASERASAAFRVPGQSRSGTHDRKVCRQGGSPP